jgi:hypothetical protein
MQSAAPFQDFRNHWALIKIFAIRFCVAFPLGPDQNPPQTRTGSRCEKAYQATVRVSGERSPPKPAATGGSVSRTYQNRTIEQKQNQNRTQFFLTNQLLISICSIVLYFLIS